MAAMPRSSPSAAAPQADSETALALTRQQLAVVRHDEGPALVFAVAGAGKTTAMVHRIARLVADGVFPPEQILATTFARKNAQDLRLSLAPWPACGPVRVATLHALGRRLIQRASRQGLLPGVRLDDQEETEQSILTVAVARARAQSVPYKADLETLDRADFLSYVTACKGELAYPDVDAVDLPAAARRLVRAAPPVPGPLAYYVDLYARYEAVRRERGLITFPDMLLTGWEVLVRFPEIAAAAQAQFRCVLVDEFQDVNRAQAELLDIITRPDRHYMAIGDDDQTIYEWRGARPDFILGFAERYRARTYFISENFRCPAGPLVLANAVIAHNRRREPKRLRLTQGFAGTTALHVCQDTRGQAAALLDHIRRHAAAGASLDDLAVLVRLNAQTPPIEQALIRAGLPFRVSQPFYERLEIRTLVDYARLAWLERRLVAGDAAPAQLKAFRPAWETICNRPVRYVSRAIRDGVREFVVRHQRPLAEVLRALSVEAGSERVAGYLETLADDITWLSKQLERPAAEVLEALERRLQYEQFLRDTSGFAQTGEGRAAGVSAFIDFARDQGTLLSFMTMLRDLARARVGLATAGQPAVTLATIHQAKGREWPVVLLPQCNQGLLPFVHERDFNLEEERRLFYVALTRSRAHLHLFVTGDRPFSQFLAEAQAAEAMRAVAAMARALARPPADWSAHDALALVRHVPAFDLGSYFESWWDARPDERQAVAHRLQAFLAAADEGGLSAALALPVDAHLPWSDLAPFPPGEPVTPFPDLTPALLGPARPTAVLEGDAAVIRPGRWLHCDAGWALVEAIVDARQRPLSSLSLGAATGRVLAWLRPGPHQERIEIDVGSRRIFFPRQSAIFTCGKCRQFATGDPYLIAGRHDGAAHEGTGARAIRQRQPYLRLGRLHCQSEPPASHFG